MKIRAQGNSVRLRLTQSELEKFRTAKVVNESIPFPDGQQLKYQLVWDNGNTFTAEFNGQIVSVNIPAPQAREWIKTDREGIEQRLLLPNGDHLKVLIEKDFQCLHRRPGEDESDAFPNPEAHRGSV